MQEFNKRARAAQEIFPRGSDFYSHNALDMLRIAAFAGFDVKELTRRCCLRSGARKTNVRTVLTVMEELDVEY